MALPSHLELPNRFSSLTPELRVLVCCSRLTPELRFKRSLSDLLAKGIDWDRLQTLAVDHGVLGLLAKNLTESNDPHLCPIAIPRIVAQQKKLRAYQVFLAHQHSVVSTAIEQAQIELIHFKGIMLDHQLFGGKSLRPSGDMDILIRKKDVSTVRDTLIGLGYEPELSGDENVETVLLRRSKDYCFRHCSHQHRVEVHWSILEREVTAAINWEFLDEERSVTTFDGQTVTLLGPNDYWLVLAVHGAKHGFECLKWLADLAELTLQVDSVDVRRILAKAEKIGISRHVLLTTKMLRDVMGINLGDGITDKNDDVVDSLCSTAVDYLNAPAGTRHKLKARFQARLIDSPWRRIRYWWIFLFAVNALDAQVRNLPPTLMPLYHYWRWVRLAKKHFWFRRKKRGG